MQIFTIYDSKVGLYLTPFFMKHEADALRAVRTLTLDPDHNFCKFAGDYTLFHIGEYDEDHGICVMFEEKHNLGNLIEFHKKMPVQEVSNG